MICLDKLQKELCALLELDQSTLPSVQELLKKQGYTGIQKGDEFIDLTTPSTQTPAKESTTESSAKETPQEAGDFSEVAAFGQNYPQFYHKPKDAIEHLLETKSGHVQGAFTREDLGDITLPYGAVTNPEKHDGWGLAHIIDKRTAEFIKEGLTREQAEAKALEFAKNEVPKIIKNGRMIQKANEATKVETDEYKIILKQNWNGKKTQNKWLVTAYIKREKGESISSTPFTKEDNLSLNSAPNSTPKPTKEQESAEEFLSPSANPKISGQTPRAEIDLAGERPAEMKSLFDFMQEPQVKETKTKITTTTIKDDIKTTTTIDKTTSEHTTHKEVRDLNLPKTRAETHPKPQETPKETPKEPASTPPVQDKFELLSPEIRHKLDYLKERPSQPFTLITLKQTRREAADTMGLNPIKEFGENFTEHYHNPAGAIERLLLEKNGQVAGAFYRKELGDIDLVWGDEKMGLAHILARRADDFMQQGMSKEQAEAKAAEFARKIPDIIENGALDKKQGRAFIDTGDEKAVIALDYNGENKKWVLSAYPKDEAAPTPADLHQSKLTESTSSSIVESATRENPTTTKQTHTQETQTLPTQEAPKPTKEQESAKNYHWSAREEIKDPTQRLEANITALRIAKELATSGRAATELEQEALAKFSGFGGLTGAFKEGSASLKSLQEILNADELSSLRQTILDAYYTPESAIKLIYDTLEAALPKNANVLEPSMGVGRFLGLGSPDYHYTGVELDTLTHQIAQALFPKAKIANEDYLRVPFSHNQFDLVVGNPPYGETKIKYKDMHGLNLHSAFMLKNIDLARENGIIAQVVSASFLDSQTPAARQAREQMIKQAKLIGVLRLPSDSFSGTSLSTDILILQKRTRPLQDTYQADQAERALLQEGHIVTDSMGNKAGENALFSWANEYSWQRNIIELQQNFKILSLAEKTIESGNYGSTRIRYEKIADQAKEQEIMQAWSESVRKRLEKVAPSTKTIDNLDDLANYQTQFKSRQVGQIKPRGDKVARTELTTTPDGTKAITERELSVEEFALDENFERWQQLKSAKTLKGIEKATLTRYDKKITIAKSFLENYDTLLSALQDLRKLELDPLASDGQIAKARASLNAIYDKTIDTLRKITPKTPYLTTNKELKSMFESDINFTQLQGLEKPKFDENGEIIEGVVAKADIFRKRLSNPTFTPTQASSLEQALQYSQQYKGALDFDYMGKILSRDSHEVRDELIKAERLFIDEDGAEVMLDTLLSGNIRKKLAALQARAQDFGDDTLLAKSIEKLTQNIPEDVPFNKISWTIASSFIPEEVFMKWGAIKGLRRTAEGRWYSGSGFGYQFAPHISSSARRVTDADVFNAATGAATRHFKEPDDAIKFDMAINKLKKDFESFVLGDEQMIKAIEKSYNDTINIYARNLDHTQSMSVEKNFQFPNANPNINLYPTQIKAIFRAVHGKNNTLFNHEVGAGKTFTLITTAMELRRTGKSKKPLIAVPNHLVPQFTQEALALYPNARILSLQSLGAKNFKQAQAQMIYNDFDFVVVGHSVLDAMEMPISYQKAFYEEKIYEKQEAKKLMEKGTLGLRKAEQEIKNLQAKIDDLVGKKDSSKILLDFDELGIDALLVDEAHGYKNLAYSTGFNFKQLGNASGSDKADGMLMKTNYLNQNNKKIIFATGTPMANSLLEIHHMLNYLHPKGLQEMGVKNVDNFITNFIRADKVMETKADGTREFVDTAIGTNNNDTLMGLVNQVFDTIDFVQVQEQAKSIGKEIVRPDIKNTSVVVEKFDDIQRLYDEVIMKESKLIKEDRQKAMSQGINDLSIFTKAKKLSVDPRLLDTKLVAKYQANPELIKRTKLYTCAQNIIKKQEEWGDRKAAQIVFCDLKESKDSAIHTHREIKKYLLEALNMQGKGHFEPKEIVIIDDVKKENYAKLYDQINKGEVKILITTTEKTGTGANLQKKLVAMHHLDAPFRPADFTQRIGRMLRQGNEYAINYHKARKSGDTSVREFYAENFTYVTKDTLDSRLFEILENKARAFREFYRGGEVDFELDVKELMDFDFLKAEASGNKNELEFYKVRNELKNLNTQKQIQLEEFMKKPQRIAELQTQIQKLQGELDNLNTFKESAKSSDVEVLGRVVEFDFGKSQNKPSSLIFDDSAQKAKLQDLRDFMNQNKKELLAPLIDGSQSSVRLYTYGGADLIAVRDSFDELGFCFEKDGKRMFIDTRRRLESFSPSDSLNFIKILQNNTKSIAQKNQELVGTRVQVKKLEALSAEFEHQDKINALESYQNALAEAMTKGIKDPIAKPAEVAKFFSFAGVGLGVFSALYAQQGDFFEFRS